MSRLTRRTFLAGSAALSLAPRLAHARGLLVDPLLEAVVGRALEAAKAAGASYADVRIVRRRDEDTATREDHVVYVGASESYGLGVRVVAAGAWGFAASSRVEPEEAARVAALAVEIAKANARARKAPVELAPEPAHVDVWQTPLLKDPFRIPLEARVELLLAANAAAMKVPGIKFASSGVSLSGEWKLFASSEGSMIEQDITRIGPDLSVTAVNSSGSDYADVDLTIAPMQAGWEYVEEHLIADAARKAGEDAVEKLASPRISSGKRDLLLAPSNLWLTIHESVGHPTELDRALGYEANFAGTSFATTDKLNKLKLAAPSVTLYADKTTAGGLATCGYDDDGVATQRWDLVKDGLFVGYQTTREQAGWIGESRSRGTCYAQDFQSFPFQRMPNVSLKPGSEELDLEKLIAGMDDGILIRGNGSWSIDHQRYNFQFGGQTFHEIKGGKVARMLRDVAYQANSIDFWNAVARIGGPGSWELYGAMNDGKGEPGQSNAVSHGCPPVLFRNISTFDPKTGA